VGLFIETRSANADRVSWLMTLYRNPVSIRWSGFLVDDFLSKPGQHSLVGFLG
jgi:hypothetical protein